jgi:hypothetical protein
MSRLTDNRDTDAKPLWSPDGTKILFQSFRDGNTEIYVMSPTGQDGEIQAGVAWPSPRFTDQMDGTVTDNLTGLIWLKDANCINSSHPAFDGDDTAQDGKVTWQHALDFVAGMNNGTFPDCSHGYNDWRLPNRKEFFSLISFSTAYPNLPLPPGHPFTNVGINSFWSSTTQPSTPAKAIFVSMTDGKMWEVAKTDDLIVWPVRTVGGGQPEPCQPHSADYNQQDLKINLSELLRVIQFYNIGEYHCDHEGEDGYAPGPDL